jgi:hypothetical protein
VVDFDDDDDFIQEKSDHDIEAQRDSQTGSSKGSR